MATLKNKGKLATHNKVNCEEQVSTKHKRFSITRGLYHSSLWRNRKEHNKKTVERVQWDGEPPFRYSLPNWQFCSEPINERHYESPQETSGNALTANQWTNEDYFQSDPHPEAKVSQSQTMQKSGPEDQYNTYRSYDKLWRSEFYSNISAKKRVQQKTPTKNQKNRYINEKGKR